MKVIKQVVGLGAMILASRIKGVGDQQVYLNKNAGIMNGKESEDSEFLQKLDYRKGDDAKTLEEYSDAVKEEFHCTGNEIAENMPHLWGNPLMIFGQSHFKELYPSFRGVKGALLTESKDDRLCEMNKYRENPENMCISIDKGLDEYTELEQIAIELQESAENLTEHIKPGTVDKIKYGNNGQIKEEWKKNNNMYLHELSKINTANFRSAFNRFTTKEKEVYIKLNDNFRTASERFNKFGWDSVGKRDEAMVKEAKEQIKKLGESATANIVVGDAHVNSVYKGLGKAFPDRPIVVCKRNLKKLRM